MNNKLASRRTVFLIALLLLTFSILAYALIDRSNSTSDQVNNQPSSLPFEDEGIKYCPAEDSNELVMC